MSFPTVELRVVDVRTAVPAGVGVEAGMVGLQEIAPPGRIIRIVIAQPEARAIYSRWKGMVTPRPSTWDLFISTVELLGGRLQQVVITAVEEERHFFAVLEMMSDGELRTIPCRPSDALALALRASEAKIMTYEQVMAAVGVLADGSKPASSPLPADSPAPAEAGGLPAEAPPVAGAED